MLQAPPVQAGVPFALLHARAQLPQWPAVVPRFVSQPLETSPSQFPNPVAQAIWQTEFKHDGVPFVALHPLPQEPQLPAEVARLVSQPLEAAASQLP